MADLFLQSMKIKDQDVGTHSVSSITYIERLNMTCPKLMLVLIDRDKAFQDEMEIADGVEIELALGDVDARGQALFKDKFVIGSTWSEGGKLHIEALQADIFRIKQAEPKPLFFSDKTPQQILSKVFSGLKLEVDRFELKRTYHVNSGSTIAKMLLQMCTDYGAAMWLCRGTLYMKKLTPKMKGKEGYRFEFLRNNSDNPLIQSYDKHYAKTAQVDSTIRARFGWSITKGLLKSDATNAPLTYCPNVPEPQLKLGNVFVANVLNCTMAGNGDFEPFQSVELEIHRMTQEQLLDESVDKDQLIVGVRHYQQGMKFISVVELGGVEDGRN
ncbi:MAG: hypothetical protein ACRCZA_05710 [Shewanella sp.]|uniref:hypothetical protein n=1 Tax=Shewanella sp. TaxID=50422 RepID=UPI003F333F94